MTPKKAILTECRYCLNTTVFRGCSSEICKLNDVTVKSSLKRIKAHCITCIPEQSLQGVRKCDGKVTNPEPHICVLHPYRLGHNPKRAGLGRKGTFGEPFQKTKVCSQAVISPHKFDKTRAKT